jgi:hypothetical protein
VPPLVSKCVKTGKVYARRADVEAEILSAVALPPEQWLAHMSLRGGWQNETRIHLLRRLRQPGQAQLFGKILDTLMKRVEPVVERWSRGFADVDLDAIKTAVGEAIVERILDVGATRRSEFVEVSMATVIKRETLKAVDYRRVRSNVSQPQPEKRDKEGELVDPVSSIADDRPDPLQRLMLTNRPRFRQILKAVRNPLHRRAFILFHLRGWPYFPKTSGGPSLCDTFNRSDRQIRTWIDTARADMQKFLGDQQ